jgi:arabinogalactan endo-1,4-beta-galactosidase
LALAATSAARPALAQTGPAWPGHPSLPRFLVGGDISLLSKEEQLGQVYKDGGKPESALTIFKDHGWNFMRLRLWVHPTGQDIYVNDLPYTVALGRRIKKAGFALLLDIHYSDSWADPGKQHKPAAWADLPFDQLVQTVHDYSRDVITAMRKGGAMPDMVQVGNEITPGMLLPDGQDWGPGHDFKNLGILLNAGIAGVKSGSGKQTPPLIMIHIDRGGDWKGTMWYFDNLTAQHVPFDVIGLSYYPMFHGPLSGLQETLQNAATRYGKPIIVVETGYAYAPNGRQASASEYPNTPEGQRAFLAALVATVRSTPNGLGRGVNYWEPEWIPVKGLMGSWDSLTLFDDQGNALPGIDALGRS